MPRTIRPSLESVIAWLEEQAPEYHYDFMSNTSCLLAQFLKAKGYKKVSMGGWGKGVADNTPVHFTFEENCVAAGYPSTFGAALERARSLLKLQEEQS